MSRCEYLDGLERYTFQRAQSFVSYLALYILFCAGMSVVYAIAQMILFKGALRASGMIHRRLISSILRTTLRSVSHLSQGPYSFADTKMR